MGSVSVGVMYLFGPITSGLSERFGCRLVAFLGGLLCFLGMLLTSFVSDLAKLYVTYGVLWGIGSSFCYFPTLTAPGEYFCHRLSLVNGIVTAGKWQTTVKALLSIPSLLAPLPNIKAPLWRSGFVIRPPPQLMYGH